MPEYNEGGEPCEECRQPSHAGHAAECSKKDAQPDKSDAQINNEQKTQAQKPKELTPQEKTDRTWNETTKVFKEALNPKSAVKKVKEFFGK